MKCVIGEAFGQREKLEHIRKQLTKEFTDMTISEYYVRLRDLKKIPNYMPVEFTILKSSFITVTRNRGSYLKVGVQANQNTVKKSNSKNI